MGDSNSQFISGISTSSSRARRRLRALLHSQSPQRATRTALNAIGILSTGSFSRSSNQVPTRLFWPHSSPLLDPFAQKLKKLSAVPTLPNASHPPKDQRSRSPMLRNFGSGESLTMPLSLPEILRYGKGHPTCNHQSQGVEVGPSF